MKKKKKQRITNAGVLRTGGLGYNVLLGKIPANRKGFESVGQCDWSNRHIRIDPSRLTNEEVHFTIFHELIHSSIEATLIDYHLKDVQDDRFVHPFSRFLWDGMVNAGIIDPTRWVPKKAKSRSRRPSHG